MSAPSISIFVRKALSGTFIELSPYISLETGAILTSQIENPTETNAYTTADITLKGYDRTGTIRDFFAGITPTSNDFVVTVSSQMPGALNPDVLLHGYVVPNTIVFDPYLGSFSFLIIGVGRFLQTTSAEPLFQRPGYFDGKWSLYQDANAQSIAMMLIKATGTPLTCEILPSDIVQIGDGESMTVIGVVPDPNTNPPAFWSILTKDPVTKAYPVGTTVNLTTPYLRNVDLRSAVKTLMTAAGFPTEQFYASAPLPNLPGVFASPLNAGGLPGGVANGVIGQVVGAGSTAILGASTPSGTYYASTPSSGFLQLVPPLGNVTLPIVDATLVSSTALNSGPKRTWTQQNTARFGLNSVLTYYAYDSRGVGGTRYILTVTITADIVNAPYVFTTMLQSETWSGTAWGGTTLISNIESSTTDTDLNHLSNAIGMDVDPATGTLIFTDPTVGGIAGAAISLNTSSYQPGGVGLVRNRVSAMNGPTLFIGNGKVAIFQNDGTLGLPSTVNVYTVTAPGVMSAYSTNQTISPYTVGQSLKHNYGDGQYYALISDPINGISLVSWTSDTFQFGSSQVISGAPPYPSQARLLGFPYPVDLVCLAQPGGAGSGKYPMVGMFGGTLWLISNQGAGFVPYMDMTGLSVGDALGQLSILTAGFFFLTAQTPPILPGGGRDYYTFRSRSSPDPVFMIGPDPQIENSGLVMSAQIQNVFNRWAGYVKITNENDTTMFGEAGDPTYAGSSSALELSCRFVNSANLCQALATSLYGTLGAQKRWIEIGVQRDTTRVYQIGATFKMFDPGTVINRTYQIIETQTPLFGVDVKLLALEV